MLFPGIYLLCGTFPELLLSECCLYPCNICPVTFHMMFSLLAGTPFLRLVSHPSSLLCNLLEAYQRVGLCCKKAKMQEPVAGGSPKRSQSAVSTSGTSASFTSQARWSQPLLKSLARCYSFLSFPRCC